MLLNKWFEENHCSSFGSGFKSLCVSHEESLLPGPCVLGEWCSAHGYVEGGNGNDWGHVVSQMRWFASVPPLVLATVQEKGREARQCGATDPQAGSGWWDPPKLTRKEPRTQRHEEGVAGFGGGFLQTGWRSGLSAENPVTSGQKET